MFRSPLLGYVSGLWSHACVCARARRAWPTQSIDLAHQNAYSPAMDFQNLGLSEKLGISFYLSKIGHIHDATDIHFVCE